MPIFRRIRAESSPSWDPQTTGNKSFANSVTKNGYVSIPGNGTLHRILSPKTDTGLGIPDSYALPVAEMPGAGRPRSISKARTDQTDSGPGW